MGREERKPSQILEAFVESKSIRISRECLVKGLKLGKEGILQ